MKIKDITTITVFHGTCEENANLLVKNGWQPNNHIKGSQQGQTRFLYVTNMIENAKWYANEKGCDSIVKILVPLSSLMVDTEDGIGDSVEEELSLSKLNKTPANMVIYKPIDSKFFEIINVD